MSLDRLLHEIRACTACADLPLGPRPVLQVATSARLLIVGQAPGRKVHETGVPWSDASGERLRHWMGIDRSVFYDDDCVAIVPIGLCYPGRDPAGATSRRAGNARRYGRQGWSGTSVMSGSRCWSAITPSASTCALRARTR